MIHYKEQEQLRKVFVPKSIQCDKCKKILHYQQEGYNEDYFEIQEFLKIRFTGGYASIFGDMSDIACDLCQHCLMEMIKDCYRVENLHDGSDEESEQEQQVNDDCKDLTTESKCQ